MGHIDNSNKKHMDNEIRGKRLRNDGTIAYENTNAPLWFIKTRDTIYYVLGVIEVLLAFRFIFKLLGANPRSGFVAFLYSITGIFTAPFFGIFNSFANNGLSTRYIFEPAVIIGMAVYALAAWGLVKLVRLKVSRDGH